MGRREDLLNLEGIKLKNGIILTGPTGSGKTYRAIDIARQYERWAYIAPCRQLVYESYMAYSGKDSSLSTGELTIPAEEAHPDRFTLFAVYESIRDIEQYNCIIIDEAHFLSDEERGGVLYDILRSDVEMVILCSATMSLDLRCISRIRQWSQIEIHSPEEWIKKEISMDEFWARVHDGVPSILFRKYSSDCGSAGGLPITADTLPHERLHAQIAFSRGDVSFIECTNVLAQGLNFPAENILIESNMWDSQEIILQKLGRLGRPYHTREGAVLTYAVYTLPPKKIKKKKKPQKYIQKKYDGNAGVAITTWLREAGISTGDVEMNNAIIEWCNRREWMYHEMPDMWSHSWSSENKYFQPHAIKIIDLFGLEMPPELAVLKDSIEKSKRILLKNDKQKKADTEFNFCKV